MSQHHLFVLLKKMKPIVFGNFQLRFRSFQSDYSLFKGTAEKQMRKRAREKEKDSEITEQSCNPTHAYLDVCFSGHREAFVKVNVPRIVL